MDIHLEIEIEDRLRAKLYDKRDDFNFPIVNFPFMCSNIPAAPVFVVYISQLIWYSRACGSYHDFFDRELLVTRKLLNQGFLVIKLKSSLRTFYGRHHDLVNHYGVSVSHDHGYVPFVVIIILSFPHQWFIIGFVIRVIRRLSKK
jgi:hypothetical protein